MPIDKSIMGRRARAWLSWTAVLLAVTVAVSWLSGWFTDKVAPGHEQGAGWPVTGELVTATLETYQRLAPTVGSVRAIQQVRVGSHLLAEVRQINVRAGDTVQAGQVLIMLDDTSLQARAARTEAQLLAAQARERQAESDLNRVTEIYQRQAATEREYNDALRAAEVAQADVEAARQANAEARAQLAYATVTSPMDAKVIDRHTEVGDLVQPGQTLVTLEGPLQLEAQVPESLSVKLALDDPVDVLIDAIDLQVPGRVREIVPQASAASRTFLVKVAAPFPARVRSGMFGRMFIPLGDAQRLTIPASCIQTVGQLRVVYVVDPTDNTAHRRFIRLGEQLGDRAEVLSGLDEGQTVLAQPPLGGPAP